MASERFCLRWNDFESNIARSFRDLREDKDFFDVTLACGEEQLQAHKVILSACSSFFSGVLRRNPHAHPLLYLKGVKYTDLQAVLDFMYYGEANVAEKDLNSFLAVAEDLKVKGLFQNKYSNTPFSAPHTTPLVSDSPLEKPRPAPGSITFQPSFTPHDDDDIQEIQPKAITPLRQQPTAAEPQYTAGYVGSVVVYPAVQYQEQQRQLDDDGLGRADEGLEDEHGGEDGGDGGTVGDANENEELKSYEDFRKFISLTEKGKTCNLCEFSHKDWYNVMSHVESKHFPFKFIYNCSKCGAKPHTKKGLERHMAKIHGEGSRK